MDEPSEAVIVPGNRFEYLEARAAIDAVEAGELDDEVFRPGALDVLAQHVMALACAGPFAEADMLAEVRSAAPYSTLADDIFGSVLGFIESGGYALKAYDRFKRLTKGADGLWRVSHPKFIAQHRLNAGIIVEATMLTVRFKNGRGLGQGRGELRGDIVAGRYLLLRGAEPRGRSHRYRGSARPCDEQAGRESRPMAARACRSRPTSPIVSATSCTSPQSGTAFPNDVREWLEMQQRRSVLPAPDKLLIETFPREGRHYMVVYSFEGWNANQSLGMLVTRRMETMGLQPLGFVASDYAIATYSLKPVLDPRPLFSADILEHEFVDWVQQSHLLKRAFREVAVIGGLVERQHPGKRKTGKQVSFSTDLIYDVLRRYEPDHLLLRAAWDDARARMTDVGRLANLLDTAHERIVHADAERVTPLAVPVLTLIGRERVATGGADEALLIEAESLVAEAMRDD